MNRLLPCLAGLTFGLLAAHPAASLPVVARVATVPEDPQHLDFVTVEIDLTFPTSGFEVPSDPLVTRSGQQIAIDVLANIDAMFVLPALTSEHVSAEAGSLPAGDYEVESRLFVNGVLEDERSDGFTVAQATPAPGSLALAALGIAVAAAVRRRAA